MKSYTFYDLTILEIFTEWIFPNFCTCIKELGKKVYSTEFKISSFNVLRLLSLRFTLRLVVLQPNFFTNRTLTKEKSVKE